MPINRQLFSNKLFTLPALAATVLCVGTSQAATLSPEVTAVRGAGAPNNTVAGPDASSVSSKLLNGKISAIGLTNSFNLTVEQLQARTAHSDPTITNHFNGQYERNNPKATSTPSPQVSTLITAHAVAPTMESAKVASIQKSVTTMDAAALNKLSGQQAKVAQALLVKEAAEAKRADELLKNGNALAARLLAQKQAEEVRAAQEAAIVASIKNDPVALEAIYRPTEAWTPEQVAAQQSVLGGVDGGALIEYGKRWIGTPYSWGGGTPAGPTRGFAQGYAYVGFDCSSFTQHVYAHFGFNIPRVAAAQQAYFTPTRNPVPGDLVFFGYPAHHVGIYLGNGMMLDAPRTGKLLGVHKIWSSNVTYGHLNGAPTGKALSTSAIDALVKTVPTINVKQPEPTGLDPVVEYVRETKVKAPVTTKPILAPVVTPKATPTVTPTSPVTTSPTVKPSDPSTAVPAPGSVVAPSPTVTAPTGTPTVKVTPKPVPTPTPTKTEVKTPAPITTVTPTPKATVKQSTPVATPKATPKVTPKPVESTVKVSSIPKVSVTATPRSESTSSSAPSKKTVTSSPKVSESAEDTVKEPSSVTSSSPKVTK